MDENSQVPELPTQDEMIADFLGDLAAKAQEIGKPLSDAQLVACGNIQRDLWNRHSDDLDSDIDADRFDEKAYVAAIKKDDKIVLGFFKQMESVIGKEVYKAFYGMDSSVGIDAVLDPRIFLFVPIIMLSDCSSEPVYFVTL